MAIFKQVTSSQGMLSEKMNLTCGLRHFITQATYLEAALMAVIEKCSAGEEYQLRENEATTSACLLSIPYELEICGTKTV